MERATYRAYRAVGLIAAGWWAASLAALPAASPAASPTPATSGGAPGADPTAYYSPLSRINAENVKDLGFAWEFKTGTYRGMEATPIVTDGVLYTSGPWGVVYALDAADGKLLWSFDPHSNGQVARYANVDVANRGVVLEGHTLYVTALDCRTFALDARTGAKRWEVATAERATYACSGAPLVAGHTLVVGNGGGDTGPGGMRGYVSAYDLESGALRWRFYTVPQRGEAHPTAAMRRAEATWNPDRDPEFGGGGAVWDGMAYDAGANLVFIGTGNAAPYLGARGAAGRAFDRLYTASIVALDATSGRLAWHYQTTPGDIWDYDADAKMVLADLRIGGKLRKVVMQANKNGYFYVLDRLTGEPLSVRPFTYLNWSEGLSTRFRPMERPDSDYSATPRLVYPGAQGAHSWAPMSFDPRTGLVYIPTVEVPSLIVNLKSSPGASVKYIDGGTGPGFATPDRDYRPADVEPLFGALPPVSARRPDGEPRLQALLKAWDPAAGTLVWQRQTSQDYFVLDGGALSTAGNLVFAGREDGRFVAYAADTGAILKSIDTGTATMAAPMTYEVGGIQYVAVLQGHGGSIMYSYQGTAAMSRANEDRILVFKLGGSPVPLPPARISEPYSQPPARHGTEAQIEAGRSLFTTWCSKCHSLGVPAVTPDLSRLGRGIGSVEVFKSIVLGGALVPLGMARFDDVLSSDDAEEIHAFLLDRAWDAYTAQSARREAAPASN
jgi:quinohemoprotein ethanol dehydrogenase